MLQRAALLQLDLLIAAVENGLMLKDGTPYNVQWRGTEPVFIDVGSFERLRAGEPWAGYRQFCELNLFPLDAAGVPRRLVPRLAPRLSRGNHPGRAHGTCFGSAIASTAVC